eukprot:CAMPEP_0113268754 /NCGR_PEP_ID=MMETSP0008_2-20120614/21348_1 /TAXON_ID=97485 /ORGANISM="Prymnesium parvum" /LENGTH=76 /DNA_ID=CAMNT_0000117949 /DNA_START=520 /DNA_END=746 /DNA_ORIENTATION=- /assembly_acc=CAM_ASM_000153
MEAGCGAPHIHTPAASAIGLSNRIRASTERSDIRKAHLWDPSLSLSHDPVRRRPSCGGYYRLLDLQPSSRGLHASG